MLTHHAIALDMKEPHSLIWMGFFLSIQSLIIEIGSILIRCLYPFQQAIKAGLQAQSGFAMTYHSPEASPMSPYG
jgi:hypothetical protein